MSIETQHPASDPKQQVYRTTSERTVYMMVIMLGICIVGGIIFFSMWDYWISTPAPVVAMMAGEADLAAPATATGKTITQDLTFIESSDFRTLAFNALPGEDDNNPTVHMNVGDTVVFNVDNGGISFHAFGVTQGTEGIAGIIPGSEIGTMSNALKPGEGGSSEFIAGEEGTYYYICTVPGHREQGMVGEIIVGPAQGGGSFGKAAAPTGISHEFTFNFVESDDFRTLAFNALPGEDGHNPEIRVNSGDEVTITANNMGKSFHAFGVVSNPEDFNSVIWDSAIAAMANPLKPGEGGSTTFIAGAPGTYYYICTVPGHALQGMQGSFIVE
ncbi:multicopper oxidase domain-containing protein [Marine Group I thaumarchaeote]|uniref:Multicopper oxidase domain-containing protein n=1 Tax=Marine Group I thaumarchaeote TaxID=2511932 RepID=A0A7K4MXE1_9ARCH|nr:multicopper oxidase domain-containing protein [Marine Group I thaumarchaeote]